ncbi:MAG: hypothetical protein KY410_00535, partial [Proteobacteria bacterium]|nr:hypothetical protein [Pseudomonadota bacterium]
MKKNLQSLFSAVFVIGMLSAGTVHTAEPPAAAPPKPFTIPEASELRLDNGLQATLVPYGSLPKVSVQVVVRTGNLNEGEQRWLADFTSALLQEGTTNRSAQQVAADVAAMLAVEVAHEVRDRIAVEGDRAGRQRHLGVGQVLALLLGVLAQ